MSFFDNNENFVAIDADSIDFNLRKIIVNFCCRRKLNALFVSDRPLKDIAVAHIAHKNICQIVVKTDFDSADNFIYEHRGRIILCITHDRILQGKLQECGVRTIDKHGNENAVGSGLTYTKRMNKDTEKFSNSLNSVVDSIMTVRKI